MLNKNYITKFGRCVKCGWVGRLTGSELPPAVDARPRWSKFSDLLTCPSCGDDKGHCGVLSPNDGSVTNFSPSTPSPLTLPANYPDLIAAVQRHLSGLKAVALLMEKRDYDYELAKWLVQRGVRVGCYRKIIRQLPELTLPNIPRAIADELSFWLPIVQFVNEPIIVGWQLRAFNDEIKPKYVTLRLVNEMPLVHFALPEPFDGRRYPAIVVTEGWFKAEIVTWKFGVPAIGILGVGAWRKAVGCIAEAVRRWHEKADLFTGSVIFAPDVDARTNLSVASGWWQLSRQLEANGIFVKWLIWNAYFKGVDDAILSDMIDDLDDAVDETVWLASLSGRVRDALLRTKIRPRIILDKETAETLPMQISPTPAINHEANGYAVNLRVQTWLEGLTELHQKGGKILIDTSPSGSGKTKAVATIRLKQLKQAGLPVKRIVYIVPEVKRPAVPELERWHRWLGRDEVCQFWGRLSVAENEGLTQVGRQVCSFCPVKSQCEHHRQHRSKKRYLRVSWQSYNPKRGDLVICDEFSRLPVWQDGIVELTDLRGLIAWLQTNHPQNPYTPTLIAHFSDLHSKLASGESVDVGNMFGDLKDQLLWLKTELENEKSVTLKTVRQWIFGQIAVKPQARWRFIPLISVLTGQAVGSVWVEGGRMKVRWLDPKLTETVKKAIAILILDATADPAETERLTGCQPTVVSSDEPQVYPITIQIPLGVMSHRSSEKRKAFQLRLAWLAVKSLQAKGKLPSDARIGVLTHKDAADLARQVFGKDAVIGWWGRDDRATNNFYDAGVNVLVAIGLPHRNLTAIAAEQMKINCRQKTLRLAPLDPQERHWTVLKEFADWDLAERVRREVAVSYLQAAGRLRQGRRSERCFFVVFDAEPLPAELKSIVLMPEDVLPTEVLNEWRVKTKRGSQIATQVAAELRRKMKTERLNRLVMAVAVWQRVFINEPVPTNWLTKATGLDRRTLWKWVRQSDKPSPSIREKEKGRDMTAYLHKWMATLCPTLNLSSAYFAPDEFAILDYNCPASNAQVAVAIFRYFNYPVPIRVIARRFGISPDTVSRFAKSLSDRDECFKVLMPTCPPIELTDLLDEPPTDDLSASPTTAELTDLPDEPPINSHNQLSLTDSVNNSENSLPNDKPTDADRPPNEPTCPPIELTDLLDEPPTDDLSACPTTAELTDLTLTEPSNDRNPVNKSDPTPYAEPPPTQITDLFASSPTELASGV